MQTIIGDERLLLHSHSGLSGSALKHSEKGGWVQVQNVCFTMGGAFEHPRDAWSTSKAVPTTETMDLSGKLESRLAN